MASTDGLEKLARRIAHSAPTQIGERAAALLIWATIVAIVTTLFLAGYRFASIWSALAIIAWMFLAGAARASSE